MELLCTQTWNVDNFTLWDNIAFTTVVIENWIGPVPFIGFKPESGDRLIHKEGNSKVIPEEIGLIRFSRWQGRRTADARICPNVNLSRTVLEFPSLITSEQFNRPVRGIWKITGLRQLLEIGI